jgi:hypothetical protein
VPTGKSKYPVEVLAWSDTLAGVGVAHEEADPFVLKNLPLLPVCDGRFTSILTASTNPPAVTRNSMRSLVL